MPGYRIDIDTSGARSNTDALRQSLNDLAQQNKITAGELAALNARLAAKDAAANGAKAVDAYRKSVEDAARAAGLTEKEIKALGDRASQMATRFQEAQGELEKARSVASSTTSALSTLEKIVLKVGAAFAAYKVADYIKDATMLAARYETLGVVMETVGANAGFTASEMNATAKALQKTGISMVESRQQTTRLVQAHLDLSKATDLARLAQDAAVIAGENSSATFSKLVYAIQSAQPEILRTVGLNVNFESSYKKLADRLGVTTEALTENEKMQARFNAVMERAPDIAGVYERAMGTAGKAILSFSRYSEDFKVQMGTAFGPALQQFVDQATTSMKAFQDEISRPEAQQALSSLAVGSANLGTSLLKSAIPAMNNAVKALNDIVNAWNKIPAPLQGALLGGGTAALLSKFNPYAMALGTLGGMAYFGDAANEAEVAAGLARHKAAENGGTYEIKMKVDLIGPDGKPIQQTIKKKIEEVTYTASDSQKLLGSGGTDKYQLDSAWQKNLGIISQLQRKIDTGRLSQEDMTRALNDQTEAWGRISKAQESYRKSLDSSSDAAARFAEQASATLEQAKNQYEQLTAQVGGDTLSSKLAGIEKRYDAAEAAINRFMIGAKGPTDDLVATLKQLEQNKALETLLVQADAWKTSMQEATSMLHELGRLTGDPAALYGATMTSAQAWEADQKKRIGAIEDVAERTRQLGELQQVMDLKEVEARKQAYEGMSATSHDYWDAEKQLLEKHLEIVKQHADSETAYRIYAAEQWDDYNKKALERQAQYAGTFADTFAAKWSLAFGSYKSEETKARDAYAAFADDVIDLTKGIGDAVSGGFGDAIRSITNPDFKIQDFGKNVVSRALDAVAGFMEKSMKSQFTDLFSSLGITGPQQSTAALTATSASVEVASSTMEVSTATINVASADLPGGNTTLAGSSGKDTLSGLGNSLGQTAGESFTASLQKRLSSSDDGLFIGSAQGVENLIGGTAPIWQRFNNPGNMRTKGGDWASFSDMTTGLQSMVDYLKRRIDQGYDSIEKMKNIYAEGSQTWANNVSKGSGLGRDTLLVSGDADTLQRLARGVTVAEGSSKAISDDTLYKLTHGTEASSADIKQLGKTIGASSGETFYDTLAEQQSPSAQEKSGNYLALNTWDTEALLSGAGESSLSGIKWNKIGGVIGGLSQLAMGAASGNVGSMIGGGISTVGGLMTTFGTAGSLISTIGGYAGILGTVVSVVATLLSSSSKTEKTGSGYNVAINAGKVAIGGVDFYRKTTTAGYSTSTSHTAVGTGISDPDVGYDISQFLKSTAKSLKDFGKELGISTKALAEFSVPMATLTDDMLTKYKRNLSTLMAQVVLGEQGLQGAFDYVADPYETYDKEFERLGKEYKLVGGYTDAYGFSLRTLAGITKYSIDAMRRYNEESYITAQQTLPTLLVAMGQTADVVGAVSQSIADNTATAKGVSDEQYAKIQEADYAARLVDAVGDEDTFKSIMEALIKNILTDLQSYQNQAAYYAKKTGESIQEIGVEGVTIDNFWQKFSDAMHGVYGALSPDQFEQWADVSNWVQNLTTMNDAIEQWQNNIKKVNESLTERRLTAAGLDSTASATKLLADAEWELYDARKANYDASTIAAIEETQRQEKAKALRDILDDVQSELDSTLGNDVASWLRDMTTKFSDWIMAAQTLGASEQQLTTIREQEAKIVAGKLSNMMDDVMQELSTYDGTELDYNVKSLKKELSGKLYDAALLGASEVDLTNIGTLYAYKVKDAYQDQIDDVVDQLQDVADALDDFSGSLKDLIDELWRGDDSPLSLGARYAEAKKQWQEAVTDLGSSDDDTRKAAQDKIETLTTDYLDLSKQYNADFSSYYADFMDVQAILGDQYQQAKSEYDLLQDQLDAATATEENTKTTAELLDELHSLQQQQGDTWTQMMADLPTAIAEAILKAQEYKDELEQAAGGTGDSGLDQALADLNAQWAGYYTAAQQAATQYLADKAAQMTAETGQTWTAQQVLAAINDSGMTPFQHYQQYGQSEGLTWSDSNAFGDENYAYTVGGFDSTGWNTDHTLLSYLDPADYLRAKAEQLTATTGRAWTVEEVAKALADAGLTAAQHYEQYGQYEGIKAGSGYVGDTTGSGGVFDAADYLAAKTAELNATMEGGHTWTVAETAAAIAAAGLTPEEHYEQYGQYENIPGYAAGGYIPGYSADDVMLAKLRLGEFVVTPEAVQHYGVGLMDALNSRALPRESLRGYADGGLVLDDGFVVRQNRALGGGSSGSDEIAALRKEVTALREVVATMAAKTDKQLAKLVTNSDGFAIRGIKLRGTT